MSLNLPTPAAPVVPPAPPAPPAFGTSPQGQKPAVKSSQPTFIGSQLQSNTGTPMGGKTLLGGGLA